MNAMFVERRRFGHRLEGVGSSRRPSPRSPRFVLVGFFLVAILTGLVGSCSRSNELTVESADERDRSSGELAEQDEPPAGSNVGADGQDDAVDATDGGSAADDGPDLEVDGDSYVPEPRSDGLQFVFADGSLGPAKIGSTIEEIAAALGPAYDIEPEEAIRVDFPAGYSVAKDGEVLFWAIEEEGRITVLMTGNEKVGLESGLRPRLSLDDAIERHGEPTLTFGPEGREFASFEDGAGTGQVSILVAIGQFGGPVGFYESFEAGSEATGYTTEEANIKELWFWAE